jgi:hypothetical protein
VDTRPIYNGIATYHRVESLPGSAAVDAAAALATITAAAAAATTTITITAARAASLTTVGAATATRPSGRRVVHRRLGMRVRCIHQRLHRSRRDEYWLAKNRALCQMLGVVGGVHKSRGR